MAGAVTPIDDTQRRLDKLELWVNGNGQPGAKEKLACFDERLSTLEEKIDQLINRVAGLLYTVLGALIIWFFTSVLPGLTQK